MRFWDVAGPEVEAADAEPWDMPLSSMMRPLGVVTIVRLLIGAVVLYGTTGVTGLGYALAVRPAGAHPDSWLAFQFTTIGMAVGVLVFIWVMSPGALRRTTPTVALVLLIVTPLLVAWSMVSAGPAFALTVLASIQAPLYAFYALRLRWAIAQSCLLLTCVAVLLAVTDGWAAPAWAWLYVAGNVIGTGVVMGYIAVRADQLADSEHEARMELADLNHTLEDRVESQVAEIERLSGLRRFLSTQVADVVLAGGAAELSRPHRARIAVFFCDLRGFTAFTNNAEPEEVVGVLDEYYGAVGGLLLRYGATVGDYAGDGIMAYFGDPVPHEDPAAAAVGMAGELGGVMAGLVTDWQRRGYDLDYGVGLAYSYATLGVVGFDGRYDYKPVGGVVNLAARLCAKAGPGQVLLDHATYAETSEQFSSTYLGDLELKGYAGEIRAYALG